MRIFLLSLFLFTASVALGQPYYVKRYQVDEGLSHNTVISLLQDRNGMIWIGTKGGLNAYNGYSFKSYANKSNSFGTIGNNFINSLCEDKKGMIWIGTGRGLFRFNPVTEVFFQLPLKGSEGIENILVDVNDNVWFLKSFMLYRYNQRLKKLTYFSAVKGTCMRFNKAGELWIGNEKGQMFKFDPQTNTINKVVQLLDRSLPDNQKLISKLLVLDNEILVGTRKKGLLSYGCETGLVRPLLTKTDDHTDVYVRDIIAAENNNYWVATESGIYVYNLLSHRFVNLKKTPADRYALSDNAVYCLLKDKENGFWAGTFFGGLNYLSPENVKFNKYISVKGANSISGNAVREICSYDNKNIWIGTEDAGLNKLNTETGKFTQYTSTGNKNSISYPNIHGLFATKNRLYIGPFLHGLNVMDIKTGKILKNYSVIRAADGPTSDFVMCIYQTSDKRILLGTVNGGMFEYQEDKDRFVRVSFMPNNSNVYDIMEDHSGTIWAGSLQNGVFYHNPKTGVRGNIKFSSGRDYEYQIQGIFEDSRHCLWLATEGGGLIAIDSTRTKVKKMTTKSGLPSNYIFRTLEDNLGNLWISSLKGLICMNLKTKKLKVFTRANGLITDQFNYNSAYKDVAGNLYFGTVQGLIVFNPADVLARTGAPDIFLTGLQLNNDEMLPNTKGTVLKRSILYTDTVTLNYNQSSFNIEFAAFSYISPRTITYQYQMQGIGTNEWTRVKNNQRAYFTDLSPGTYTFVLKAHDGVGGWASKERKLVVKILPPFWKSLPAYIIYFLLIAVAFYLSASYYRKVLEARNQRKLQLFQFEKDKEIYQAKIEFFTNIAHEIQTPLTLIKGPLERILNRIDEVPTIKRSINMIDKNTNRLLSLTSQLLDFRKTEIDQFGLSFVKLNITQVLKQEISVFKPELEKRKIKFELDVPKTGLIAFVDYEAFTKIVSNLLSNAIKYAASGIRVELFLVENEDNRFVIRFVNDGDPIPFEVRDKIFEPFYRVHKDTDKPGTGIGLPIARSLAELHTGSLTLAHSDELLIVFELTLPIHHSIEFSLNKWKKL
ncbi:ligand-binding sensor domain-containing protein [Pedobacter endophyticus]|nr:sensor histidine kinase [Pedobacter endophyticus]